MDAHHRGGPLLWTTGTVMVMVDVWWTVNDRRWVTVAVDDRCGGWPSRWIIVVVDDRCLL